MTEQTVVRPVECWSLTRSYKIYGWRGGAVIRAKILKSCPRNRSRAHAQDAVQLAVSVFLS